MYLKKISTNRGITTYHCKSKSQGKRWLRSKGLTQFTNRIGNDSLSYIAPNNMNDYARLFYNEYHKCWVIHYLPPAE